MSGNGGDIPSRISVLGAARSGVAAAKALSQRGTRVFLSETKPERDLDFLLASNGIAHIAHEAGGHTDAVLRAEAIILSPGIPADIPILKEARNRAIPVWSEIELGCRLAQAPIIAVTGSTGKSTTISLVGAILRAAGKESAVAGNIGLPLTSVAASIPADGFLAVEVSSFQLETIDRFHPRSAAVLNLMKNHLDRYPDEEAYYRAKKAIARNMNRDDCLTLNAADPRLAAWALEMQDKTNIVFFGEERGDVNCFWVAGESLFARLDNTIVKLLDVKNMKLAGAHNYANAAAAAALAWGAGIDLAPIRAGLVEFAGLPHRLEYVAAKSGVLFYNDSKATTAEAVIAAMRAFGRNVILIAGGRDKGCDFAAARLAVQEHAKSVLLIGEAADRIEKEWRGLTTITRHSTLEEAVESAYERAAENDVVVLSPGCSSFDMFAGYEQRGDAFKAAVAALEER
jgi:UDP-N-acetylmuramoylalanine--D-glutamate ligase